MLLRNHCEQSNLLERRPVSRKNCIFNNHCSTFHIQMLPVLRDHAWTPPLVVFEDRFDCTCTGSLQY